MNVKRSWFKSIAKVAYINGDTLMSLSIFKFSCSIFLFALINCVCLGKIAAQDPVFSQYYNSPLQLNPAFAGNATSPIFVLNYRNQWPSWPAAYRTFSFSYDQFFEGFNSGIGFSILSDDAGDGILKSINVSGIYSYRVIVNDDLQIKFGIEASLTQLRLDWNKLLFLDQIDPAIGATPGGSVIPSSETRPNDLTNYYMDISTGMLIYNRKYYAGFSLKHLNSPNNSFVSSPTDQYSGVPVRLSLHGGYQIHLEPGNKYHSGTILTPNILFVKQSGLSQINVGTIFGLRSFHTGVWYRHAFKNPDAFIFSFGVRSGVFKISYSFDFTVSELAINNTGGSHELGILINLESLAPKKSKYNDCFSIFR